MCVWVCGLSDLLLETGQLGFYGSTSNPNTPTPPPPLSKKIETYIKKTKNQRLLNAFFVLNENYKLKISTQKKEKNIKKLNKKKNN